MQASQVTTESKSFIREMDDFLKDLETWKKTRTVLQDSAESAQAEEEETKSMQVSEIDEDRLRAMEEEFMRKADEREQQILEKLKALNIDPTAPQKTHSEAEEETK